MTDQLHATRLVWQTWLARANIFKNTTATHSYANVVKNGRKFVVLYIAKVTDTVTK